MASVGGIDLGRIQNESQVKDSGLFTQPLVINDSANTILLDLFGVTRTISIDGIKTGSVAVLNTFITDIEGIENGTQTSSTFVSSLSTFANKTVFIKSFRWNYLAGNPGKITYSLELIEGAAVS